MEASEAFTTIQASARAKAKRHYCRMYCRWTDIVNLAAGDYYLVGLKADGTILFAGSLDEIGDEAANKMSAWQNIVQISAGHDYVIALTENGKVLCAGKDDYGQCDFNGTTIHYSDSQIQN